jgi:hypothetical protein
MVLVLALTLVPMAMLTPSEAADVPRDCLVPAGSVTPPSPAGFSVRVPLLDFFVIQRALMTVQDEKAPQVLERLRLQVLEQSRP